MVRYRFSVGVRTEEKRKCLGGSKTEGLLGLFIRPLERKIRELSKPFLVLSLAPTRLGW